MKIKLSQEESDFVQNHGASIEGEWFYIPFWYHKVGENIWEQASFDKLPNHVKEIIKEHRETIIPKSY